MKEIINRGGEKVSPLEVDNVLMEHPAVQQVVTFAVADKMLGEEIGAAGVLADGGDLDAAIAGLDRAVAEVAEVQSQLEQIAASFDDEGGALEKIEDRLFALRDLARKHRSEVDDLPAMHADLARRLAALDQDVDSIAELRAAADAAHAAARRDACMGGASQCT